MGVYGPGGHFENGPEGDQKARSKGGLGGKLRARWCAAGLRGSAFLFGRPAPPYFRARTRRDRGGSGKLTRFTANSPAKLARFDLEKALNTSSP